MKKHEDHSDDIKTDLKHDTMEFSAATDGDDKLDLDTLADDDSISGEELDFLEEDDAEMGAALVAVETDRLADADNLPEETDEDDYYDEDAEAEDSEDERL